MTHKQTKNPITRLMCCLKGKRKLTATQGTVAKNRSKQKATKATSRNRTKSQSNANLREKEKAPNHSEPFVMSNSIVVIFALEKQTYFWKYSISFLLWIDPKPFILRFDAISNFSMIFGHCLKSNDVALARLFQLDALDHNKQSD